MSQSNQRNLTFSFPWAGAADRKGLSPNPTITFSAIAHLLLMEFGERQFQLHVLFENLEEIFNNQNTHYLPSLEVSILIFTFLLEGKKRQCGR